MESIKIVGKSGQISLGKSLAGRGFVLQVLDTGDKEFLEVLDIHFMRDRREALLPLQKGD